VQRGEETIGGKRKENVGLEMGPHFILILGFLRFNGDACSFFFFLMAYTCAHNFISS
jgi:hypothetical protein